MEELIENVNVWAIERGLEGADPKGQLIKFFEEAGELASGLARENLSEMQDAIGDVLVTLIVFSLQKGLTLEDCLEVAWNEIKDRKGKLIDGIFVKEADLK